MWMRERYSSRSGSLREQQHKVSAKADSSCDTPAAPIRMPTMSGMASL
eukprot:CAMPEP_0195584494 /NCGR_PEP_ID=MMETSP0814-20130614/26027_1 /TAXON_ID=97485 /ORGANISM="Prymnesium parvum, Strain Texoma1" /LENGTH=47 /DNA_ID= /DNA_START= /DNA_END= /DNA_ORIENTATION=